MIEQEYDQTFGPRLQMQGKDIRVSTERGYSLVFHFDDYYESDEEQPVFLPENFEWDNSGLSRAASAYQRECGWDFAPGEAGVWLVHCLLTGAWGGGDSYSFNSNIVGFVVLVQHF
jgi:hypothetical protein